MILEGGETRDDLPVNPETRDLVRDPLFCLRNYFENRLAQLLQGGSFRFRESRQVLINLATGHILDSRDTTPQGQEASDLRLPRTVTGLGATLRPGILVAKANLQHVVPKCDR
jgi:hypothetical protein